MKNVTKVLQDKVKEMALINIRVINRDQACELRKNPHTSNPSQNNSH